MSPAVAASWRSAWSRVLRPLWAGLAILCARLPAGRLGDRLLDRLAGCARRMSEGPPLPPGAGAGVRGGLVERALTLGWAPSRQLRRLEAGEILAGVRREDEVVPAVDLLLAKGGARERAWDLVALFEEEGAAGEWEELSRDWDGAESGYGAGEGSDERATPGPPRPRLTAAFLTVARSAETLPPASAEPLLLSCLRVARRQVDPYEPARHVLLARHAAAVLVAEHPELDPAIHRLLDESPGEELTGIVAAGLRRRRTGRIYGVADALAAWCPGEDGARLFSRALDLLPGRSPQSRPEARRQSAIAMWRVRGLASAANLLAVAAPPVLALLGGWVAARWVTVPPPASVTLGTALTIVGLLFGVDVYATEQTAIRLPGSLARYINRTRSLHGAYSGALTMTAGVLMANLLPALRDAVTWGTLVAIGYFAVASILVLRSFIAGLEPGEAAATFVAMRRRSVHRAGRAFGRIQRKAVAIREQAAALHHVRMVAAPPVREGSVTIDARKRGFLLPSPRALRRLRRRRRWRDGSLTLHVSRHVGEVTRAHARIAVITADAGSRVGRREERRVRRMLNIEPARGLDSVSESGAVLLRLAGKLLEDGDDQAAERVAQALVHLVEVHLAGVHSTQGEPTGVRPPAVPLLENLLNQLVADAIGSTTGNRVAFLVRLADEILAWTGPQDGAAGILLTAVRRESGEDPFDKAEDRLEEGLGGCLGDPEADPKIDPAGSDGAGDAHPGFVADGSEPGYGNPGDDNPADGDPRNRQAAWEMLRLAAIHALELRDVDGLLPILDEIGVRALAARDPDSSGGASGSDLAAVSEIAALAMDLHPTAAPILWAWFAGLAGWSGAVGGGEADEEGRPLSTGAPDPALVAAARVGAAALEAGMFSIALEVAICLSRRMDDGPEAVRGALESASYLRREAIRSERRGGYLGERPADVILRFARFVGRLTPAIA